MDTLFTVISLFILYEIIQAVLEIRRERKLDRLKNSNTDHK